MASALITGGSVGLGKEAARLMAERADIDHVIITSRSAERGAAAVDDLRSSTGDAARFTALELDTASPASVARFAEVVDPVDAAVLNAGGVTGKTALELGGYGVTNIMATNVVGHVDLVHRMMEADKINESVTLVSSEAARGVKALRINAPEVDTTDLDAVRAVMTGRDDKTSKDLLYMYANVKLFGSLWAADAARRNPDLRIVSVSPGSTRGTEAALHMPFPMNKMLPTMMNVVMPLFKLSHSLTLGAQRYVDVAIDPSFKTGGFYASPQGRITGDLVDQRTAYPRFAAAADQRTVSEAIGSLASIPA